MRITVIKDIMTLGEGVSVGIVGKVFRLYLGRGFLRIEVKDDSVNDSLFIYIYSSTFGSESIAWLKGLLQEEPLCFFWGKHFRTRKPYHIHCVTATRSSEIGIVWLSCLDKLFRLDLAHMKLRGNLMDDSIRLKVGRLAVYCNPVPRVDFTPLTLERFLQNANTEWKSKIQPAKQAARLLVQVSDKFVPTRRQYYPDQWSFWASDDSNFLPHYKRVKGLSKINAVHFTVVNTDKSIIKLYLKPRQMVSFIAILDTLDYDGHLHHDIRVGEIDPQWKCIPHC